MFHQSEEASNVDAENLPCYANINFNKFGTKSGICSFAVSGLTDEDYNFLTWKVKINWALKQLKTGSPFIAYGHASTSESIYGNPHLYPGMFSWLFSYGLDRFDNEKNENFGEQKEAR